MIFKTVSHCRTCHSERLELILDLGETPFANDFTEPHESIADQPIAPLRLLLCQDCSLVQLGEVVDPKVLYSRYAYVTSNSSTMEKHLAKQCENLLVAGKFEGSPKVLEIASNTGVYLKQFQKRGCNVLGIEPAGNIAEIAEANGIPTSNTFFDKDSAATTANTWGSADLILGRHVLAHIHNLDGVLDGLTTLANDKTLVVFEFPCLIDFFQKCEYDTVYHEHLSYFSVKSLLAWTKNSPFMVQRIDHHKIHGGSIAVHLRLRSSNHKADESVASMVAQEETLRLQQLEAWTPFVKQTQRIQKKLPKLIRQLRSEGKTIIAYGASAKGNTLLNTCGIDSNDIDLIIDNTPFKQGKMAPGSEIPVHPPEALLEQQPDYALLLAWNFAEEIIGREQKFQERGGRFIIPIPNPHIVPFEAG
jgi:hypothetical protein